MEIDGLCQLPRDSDSTELFHSDMINGKLAWALYLFSVQTEARTTPVFSCEHLF